MLLHPAIVESGFAGLEAAASSATIADDLPAPVRVCADLLQRFARVSDGRRDQGRVHPVAVVLALCAAAVVAGMASFTAIAGWATDVPAELLAQLYGRASEPPSKATIWRVVTGADAAAVDAVIGAWLLTHAAARDDVMPGDQDTPEPLAIMVDGKAVRGATPRATRCTCSPRPSTTTPWCWARSRSARSPTRSPSSPRYSTLSPPPVSAHTVITADDLHTQRAHAVYLHERGAGFVFTCKQNQPRLFAALDALPWEHMPVAARQVDRGLGRVTTRTIQVLPAPADLPFPHVNQVWLIERYVADTDGKQLSAIAALGVTNLPAEHATPQRLASLVRNHWGIESLHWLRDTVYREDDSTVRTRSGPRVMAGLRNLAVGAHHLAGRRDITEASREASRVMQRPFKVLNFA